MDFVVGDSKMDFVVGDKLYRATTPLQCMAVMAQNLKGKTWVSTDSLEPLGDAALTCLLEMCADPDSMLAGRLQEEWDTMMERPVVRREDVPQ